MQPIGLNELREMFLSFFESKGHLRMPGFSLIPRNDKSLLLINSGMAPLKPYFTGAVTPPCRRVATCQKCIRTPDIDNVGMTARHGTFFEMLGNFSFGDYFKREAIAWGWEFFTETLGMPPELLYASVYLEDDEAHDIWRDEIGVPESHIIRLGKADNFWEHGLGPCGPCSEIYFDRGPEHGCGKPGCAPGCDCDRYVEVWNLVFTQFDRKEDGSYERLKSTNIDTGMGLERLACVMQGVNSIFEVDTIHALLDAVCGLTGARYNEDLKRDVSIRIITDHIRSASMMVADGVIPSNEGRGYVLRRLLRRAALHGRKLGAESGFLSGLSANVVSISGQAYPELIEKSDFVKKIILNEEERFEQTLGQGLAIFNDSVAELEKGGGATIGGDLAFKLHDTYGFPLDVTKELAGDRGLGVDEAGFRERMDAQKAMARAALQAKDANAWAQGAPAGLEKLAPTEFVGYGCHEADALVLCLYDQEGGQVEFAGEGESVTVVLDRTPLYAESGGQLADSGVIAAAGGEVAVFDCKKTENGVFLHHGTVTAGSVAVGDAARVSVDAGHRSDTEKNHTATHLLQAALKLVLGDHINQSGSQVGGDKLRFDFNHFEQVGRGQLDEVERIVNEEIFAGLGVDAREMGIEEAKQTGAQALFGEKYGSVVRVVSAGEFSRELCGGTHVRNTSEIGLFTILSEGGVAAGIRRIEALTGRGAFTHLKHAEHTLRDAAALIKSVPDELLQRIEHMQKEIKDRDREIDRLTERMIADLAGEALAGALPVDTSPVDTSPVDTSPVNAAEITEGSAAIRLVVRRYDHLDVDGLGKLAEKLRGQEPACVALLASGRDGRANFAAAAGEAAIAAGVDAGRLVKAAAAAAGGGGGGRRDMARAGGKEPALISKALDAAPDIVRAMLGK